MRRGAALFLVMALEGCKDETPPHWRDVCVESHRELVFVKPLLFVEKCDRIERQCLRGADYQGKDTCP